MVISLLSNLQKRLSHLQPREAVLGAMKEYQLAENCV